MTSLTSSLYLMAIAYPALFIIMGIFVALTYGLTKAFPPSRDK
ncbi:MAG: hypothetical protein SPI25_00335 [Dialister sp.]|nr:hypothetical protein [Dialister sp.]